MKTRESGMPPDEKWKGFFDPHAVGRGWIDLPPYHYGFVFQKSLDEFNSDS